jgi:hypothetical protein
MRERILSLLAQYSFAEKDGNVTKKDHCAKEEKYRSELLDTKEEKVVEQIFLTKKKRMRWNAEC